MNVSPDYSCASALRPWAVPVIAAVLLATSFLSAAVDAQAANSPALRLIKLIPIYGTASNPNKQMNSFDISWYDESTGLYYLADRSNAAIDVVDTLGRFTGVFDSLLGQIGGSAFGFAGDTGKSSTSGPKETLKKAPAMCALTG